MAKPGPNKVSIWLKPVQVLLLFALVISLYLLFESFRGGGVVGCGPESGCNAVLSSRWSYVLGLPISLLAATLYCTMLAALHAATNGHPPARHILAGGAWLIIGAAVWFLTLQAAVLKAYCWYCVTAHLAGAAASAVVLFKLAPPFRIRTLALPAALMAVLLLAQIKFPTKTFTKAKIDPLQATNQNTNSTLPQAKAEKTEAAAATVRQLPVMGGRFQIPVQSVPMVGDLTTTNILVKLFDYTCHHCRHLHELLAENQSGLTNVLVVFLPMPLDGNCNRMVRQTPAAHAGACEYAKLSLAIWNAAPAKWKEFDDYVWSPAKPAPIEQVKAFASTLVGEAQLRSGLTNARVQAQINLAIGIYEANSKLGGRSSLPQLLFPQSSIVGGIRDASELRTLLETSF